MIRVQEGNSWKSRGMFIESIIWTLPPIVWIWSLTGCHANGQEESKPYTFPFCLLWVESLQVSKVVSISYNAIVCLYFVLISYFLSDTLLEIVNELDNIKKCKLIFCITTAAMCVEIVKFLLKVIMILFCLLVDFISNVNTFWNFHMGIKYRFHYSHNISKVILSKIWIEVSRFIFAYVKIT